MSGEPVYLNKLKTAYVDDTSIRFRYLPDLEDVSYSKVFLKIVARSTDLLSTRSSPLITDYSLLVRESDAV